MTVYLMVQLLPESAEVEVGVDSVATLVTTGHDLPIGAEEEATQ